MQWISSLVQDQTIPVRLVQAVHYQRFIPSFGVQFLEVCIPVDSAYANVALAVRHLMETIDEFETMGRYPANLTMQLRFVRGSSALLATCYDADARNTPTKDAGPLFCYIEILSILHTPDWDNFVKEIGLKWMAIEGALPHWPKQFDQIPEVRALVRQRLGQRLERFREARVRAGVDPNDMFSNAFTDDILFND